MGMFKPPEIVLCYSVTRYTNLFHATWGDSFNARLHHPRQGSDGVTRTDPLGWPAHGGGIRTGFFFQSLKGKRQ